MKTSIDLYTEHVWLFLDSFEEFDYIGLTCLPPGTILQFSEGTDRGYGRIIEHKVSHDYCLIDVIWNTTTCLYKTGGAICPFCIDSGDIVQAYGSLSLKWKSLSVTLKKAEEEMKRLFEPTIKLIETSFLGMREDLYLKLILFHRENHH